MQHVLPETAHEIKGHNLLKKVLFTHKIPQCT